jgi:hypothetical protein
MDEAENRLLDVTLADSLSFMLALFAHRLTSVTRLHHSSATSRTNYYVPVSYCSTPVNIHSRDNTTLRFTKKQREKGRWTKRIIAWRVIAR